MIASRGRLPANAIQRGQLLLLVLLAVITAVAWIVTLQQARTSNMSMGVVAGSGSMASDQNPPSATTSDEAAADDSMDSMPGMSGGSDEASSGSTTSAIVGSEMTGMSSGDWTWDGLATFIFAWAVMMAAMMFPAAAPMLLMYRSVAMGRKARGGTFVPVWVFAAGYLLVWIGAGVGTWLLVRAGSDLADRMVESSRHRYAPVALGVVLVVAGLYQFTSLKGICLRQCQSPMGFVMTHWRDGYRGALQMGFVHGLFCLGCCWALFAVLVAAGVMSIGWMLLLTLVVFLEKVAPMGTWGTRVVGFAFLGMGLLVMFNTIGMPWVA